MGTSILQSANQPVQIPRVWFFPKSRMERDVRRIKGCIVMPDGIGVYTSIRRGGEEVARYSRKSGEYYPRLEMVYSDEEVKQAVAPYVMFVKRK